MNNTITMYSTRYRISYCVFLDAMLLYITVPKDQSTKAQEKRESIACVPIIF